jgi:hypothetical protein
MNIALHGFPTLGEIIKAIVWDLPKEIITKPFGKKPTKKDSEEKTK